jgi:OmcA/MtrC family decaheme c-type cytochrome
VKSVSTWSDTGTTPPTNRPQITFKLKNNGTDVVFQDKTTACPTTTAATCEIMAGFIGSPSVYFAFAVPQDGIQTPADFNATASGYIKNIWNGTATGTGAGTLTGPDTSGYYTIKLTGVQIPTGSTMLTGGVGYTYALSSTPPLTEIDLTKYPLSTDGKKQGGLIVPAQDVWKVATGFTGRRAIVDTKLCNNCHGGLGVAPNFHAGQRNDGATCSFCHNDNKTSSGWNANSKYFIHAIHGARQRSVPYTWHASSATQGFQDVEFPGQLNQCTSCHLPGTYDMTATASSAAFPNWNVATVATGKFDGTSPTAFSLSPYVMKDNLTDYGAGFGFNAGTGVTTPAAGTSLVMSPLTGVCSSCHDSNADISHMTQNGGSFYSPRSQAVVNGTTTEECMICHGPGRTAAIGEVHKH